MKPSLVGYLCVNCGHVQRFYSDSESAMAAPAPQIMPMVAHAAPKSTSEPKNNTKPSKRQIKATLKRLMVPELPEPHDYHASAVPNPNTSYAKSTELAAAMTAPTVTKMDTSKQMPPNQSSNLSELQVALHPKQDTSLWVLISLAVLMLIFAGVLLLLIIIR